MLNFWACWCAPCRLEIPELAAAYAEHRDRGLEIVAINVREKPDRVADFVERYGVTFPVVLDRTGEVRQAYFVRALPTSVFIDEGGVVRAVHVGGLTESMLRKYLEQLLGMGA